MANIAVEIPRPGTPSYEFMCWVKMLPGGSMVAVSDYWLVPAREDLPVRTWRNEGPKLTAMLQQRHKYPQAGCQGEPFTSNYPNSRTVP